MEVYNALSTVSVFPQILPCFELFHMSTFIQKFLPYPFCIHVSQFSHLYNVLEQHPHQLRNNTHHCHFSPWIPEWHCTRQHKWEEGRNVFSQESLECNRGTSTWSSHTIGNKMSALYGCCFFHPRGRVTDNPYYLLCIRIIWWSEQYNIDPW